MFALYTYPQRDFIAVINQRILLENLKALG